MTLNGEHQFCCERVVVPGYGEVFAFINIEALPALYDAQEKIWTPHFLAPHEDFINLLPSTQFRHVLLIYYLFFIYIFVSLSIFIFLCSPYLWIKAFNIGCFLMT